MKMRDKGYNEMNGWQRERHRLTLCLMDRGLLHNTAVALCAALVWKRRGLWDAMAFCDRVANDRMERGA